MQDVPDIPDADAGQLAMRHEHVDIGHLLDEPRYHGTDRVLLVERGNDDERALSITDAIAHICGTGRQVAQKMPTDIPQSAAPACSMALTLRALQGPAATGG